MKTEMIGREPLQRALYIACQVSGHLWRATPDAGYRWCDRCGYDPYHPHGDNGVPAGGYAILGAGRLRLAAPPRYPMASAQ